jgi:hypothetical protein
MNEMKYYLAKLLEINGEAEYTHVFLIVTAKNPDKALTKIASEWYDGKQERDDGFFRFGAFGQRAVAEEDIQEIDKYTFDNIARCFTKFQV